MNREERSKRNWNRIIHRLNRELDSHTVCIYRTITHFAGVGKLLKNGKYVKTETAVYVRVRYPHFHWENPFLNNADRPARCSLPDEFDKWTGALIAMKRLLRANGMSYITRRL